MNRLLIIAAIIAFIFAPELRSILGLKPQPTKPEPTYWCLDRTTNRNYKCDHESFIEDMNKTRVELQRQSDKDLEMYRKIWAESEARDRSETERLYNEHAK
ncbi:hypothetical protein I8752_29035 [Nostocaceae cyanobacterium CENA369]|uniref:Uncharacterized protein n=1 Tax=Dendronalium phyllosphericum CENA369 TaxID=1725256 RepID=A0A8J7LH34_9NOST|nr:hypothetical protein [Dendronalium phyllosphericum]MBH8576956.1 hypothetical protein [Dendronalium phyllosphericum CENA369]